MTEQTEFPKRTPFRFRQSLMGRLRGLWHGVAGRWVETHQLQEQNQLNLRLHQQQLDLAELVSIQDRELTELKRALGQLAAELRQAHDRLAVLEQSAPETAEEPLDITEPDAENETADDES